LYDREGHRLPVDAVEKSGLVEKKLAQEIRSANQSTQESVETQRA
jgi:hypothetical protein